MPFRAQGTSPKVAENAQPASTVACVPLCRWIRHWPANGPRWLGRWFRRARHGHAQDAVRQGGRPGVRRRWRELQPIWRRWRKLQQVRRRRRKFQPIWRRRPGRLRIERQWKMWVGMTSVNLCRSVRDPEQEVRKASHCGSKQKYCLFALGMHVLFSPHFPFVVHRACDSDWASSPRWRNCRWR